MCSENLPVGELVATKQDKMFQQLVKLNKIIIISIHFCLTTIFPKLHRAGPGIQENRIFGENLNRFYTGPIPFPLCYQRCKSSEGCSQSTEATYRKSLIAACPSLIHRLTTTMQSMLVSKYTKDYQNKLSPWQVDLTLYVDQSGFEKVIRKRQFVRQRKAN